MPRRIRMAPVDTAWLRMDSPGNLMMIVGVDVFEKTVDVDRLRALLLTHLCAYREFRSRVVVDPSGAWWEDVDGQFDINHHLVRIALPGTASTDELQVLTGTLASQSLDHTKPLWQFHLVENYRPVPDGPVRHALIVRIHHCIADGIALISVLLSLTTTAADSQPPAPHGGERENPGDAGLASMLKPFTAATVKMLHAAGDLAARGLRASQMVLDDPNLAAESATKAAQIAIQVGQDAAALALMASDTPTSLKGKPSGSKVVAWSDPLALADVKAAGKAIGCSVNDVLLACVSGAFRRYLLDCGDELTGAGMRAMVPVNLRTGTASGASELTTLGNKFGLVPLLMPIGIDGPVERVLEIQRRMNALKGGYMPVLAMAVLGATGIAPRVVQQRVLNVLAKKATAVMTNVPGPQQALYMAGAQLAQMMFWVPQSGDIGVGVSILSYNGNVQFGLITDKKLCADPQAVISRFRPEFEALVHELLLRPWEKEGIQTAIAENLLGTTEQLADAASGLAGQATQPSRDENHRTESGSMAPKRPGRVPSARKRIRTDAPPPQPPPRVMAAKKRATKRH